VSQAILDGITMKLVRAEQHVNELRAKLEAFSDSDPNPLVGEAYPNAPHQLVLRVIVRHAPDPYWGAILGDILQNCRSVLDHIFSALVEAVGADSRTAYFPIYKTRGEFNENAVPKLIKYGLPDAQRTLIESVQPYSATIKLTSNHPAWVLRELANIDKHHTLIPSAVKQERMMIRVIVDGVPHDVPADESRIKIDGETELARLDLPDQAIHTVDVQSGLATRIYIEDEWPIQLCADGVLTWVRDEVVPRFAPILRKL
jgi:hypothetical protein